MAMPTSTITSKGQTTIPKAVREHLGLKPGNRIDYLIEEDGRVVIRPSTYDIRDLEGLLSRAGGAHLSVEEMNRVVRERHASRGEE